MNVVLALTNPRPDSARLGHGFRVIARIVVWRGKDLLTVPVGALFREGVDWAVYTDMAGRAHMSKVILGERNDDFAVVND